MSGARKGMLLVVERRRASTVLYGPTTEDVTYEPATVNTISRDGTARTAWGRNNLQIKLGGRDAPRWWTVEDIPKGAAILHSLPESFETIEAAREAIRPHLTR